MSTTTHGTIHGVRLANLNGQLDCPECETEGPHQDNGARGASLTFCCAGCGTHFDAADLVTEPRTYYAGTLAY